MLASNGRTPKQRRNYHMTLDELAQLLEFLRLTYHPKWRIMVLTQFGLGLRVSEVSAIQLSDFKDDFRFLDYRETKTNKMIYDEPIPESLRTELKEYVRLNQHTFTNGYIFAKCGTGLYTSETIGSFWCKWRKACAKYWNNPKWLDEYVLDNGMKRHRIGSHSLRRLHRTHLAKNLNNDYLCAMICHYKDTKVLTVYRNEFELLEKRGELTGPILNPLIDQLTRGVQIVPDAQREAIATAKAIPLLDNKRDIQSS